MPSSSPTPHPPMSLLNVLRGSQSLPLTRSTLSLSSSSDSNATTTTEALTYYYYHDPSTCTFEEVLIETLLFLSNYQSQSQSQSQSLPRLIEKQVNCPDVSPDGLLPIWVNCSNGHVLTPSTILSTYFPKELDDYDAHCPLITQLSEYFRVKNKHALSWPWNRKKCPVPVLPSTITVISKALSYSIFHCAMYLLSLDDPLRVQVERDEGIAAGYLEVLELK